MKHVRSLAAVATAILLVGAACAGDDDADTASDAGSGTGSAGRTVEVAMRDIAFSPERVEVEQGETVRFVFTNEGKVVHDAFVGDEAAQDEHEREMREQDGDDMGHGHGGDEEAVTLEPGATGELTHTFDEGGSVLIGCHQPGHYAAGMKLAVAVA